MIASAARTIQKTGTSTILRRIAKKDRTAVKDCINTYGNLVWALATKFTASSEEAEAVTEEIFADIWRYCESESDALSTEEKLITMIALRRLVNFPRKARKTSMANMDAPNDQGAGMDRVSGFI